VRRRYCVSYDISDDKRRATVYKMLFGYGDHAQYSVFFCELNDEELAELRGKLRKEINHAEDQVMLIDLGLATNPIEAGLEVLGRGYDPPTRVIVV
jgi:CRISPR-associated protein Cas2